MKILITGAAGYIGKMLIELFRNGPDVTILALDRTPEPDDIGWENVQWYTRDLTKKDWLEELEKAVPDVVIHTAWNEDAHRVTVAEASYNERAAAHLFDACFRMRVPKLIHLSAIDGYGTVSGHVKQRMYIENDALREAVSPYGIDIVRVEAVLKKLYGGSSKRTQTFILRLPMVYGPRAHMLRHTFGVLKFWNSALPSPFADPDALAFQVLHEDDLIDALGLLTFNTLHEPYDVYNVAPQDVLTAREIGEYFRARVIPMSKAALKLLPNIHPRRIDSLIADGRKITTKFNYQYNYSSYEALTRDIGRYASGTDNSQAP